MTTLKKNIDGQRFEVNSLLTGYELHHTPESSYVAFFGLNLEEEKFFMQFNNGTAFIYDMPAEEQQAALDADSIGKHFHAKIKNNYVGEQIAALSVAPDLDLTDDEEDYGDAGEEYGDDPAYNGDRY